MTITKEQSYWHCIIILEAMRYSEVKAENMSIFEIYDLVPLGIIKKAIETDNPFPIAEWVIKEFFKAEYIYEIKV